MKRSLKDSLEALSRSDYYPFHMPGHKRRSMGFMDPYKIDITEIEGFDNLHHPTGILKESMEQAAEIYGSSKSYYLVGGSTCGILSAISSAVKRRGKILMARNCHKAVYHGVFLNELQTVYTYPHFLPDFCVYGGVNVSEIEILLKTHKDIDVIFITSPTYEGVVSDIKSIAECAHQYGIPLIVDEAHGAHFNFGKEFPVSAVNLGADIVIQSLHKTLPALTQTAILHVNGNRIDTDRLEQFLSIYQSSSPSYLLMASIEECILYMDQKGRKEMDGYFSTLIDIRSRLDNLSNIRLMGCNMPGIYDLDLSKLVFSVRSTNLTGSRLQEILLEKYHLETEMSGIFHVLAMSTVFDTQEGLGRLLTALREIDLSVTSGKSEIKNLECITNHVSKTIYQAMSGKTLNLTFSEAEGKVSAEFLYAYPPGIPILVPGEVISQELINKMRWYQECGLSVQGLKDKSLQMIEVANGEDGE